MRTTILGLGNILLQDEGFGVRFLDYLNEKYIFPDSVSLVDGGTLGYGLLNTISSCDLLLVIDIIKSDDPPGSLYRFNRSEMELHLPAPTSAHEVEFFDVLSKAEMMGELPETVFLCIAPRQYGGELNNTMSRIMHDSFPTMEKLLFKELKNRPLLPSKREVSE
jgi:hydrogenase maturation protease